jgi:hypothetical protein
MTESGGKLRVLLVTFFPRLIAGTTYDSCGKLY